MKDIDAPPDPDDPPEGISPERWRGYCDGFSEAMRLVSSAASAWHGYVGSDDDGAEGDSRECGSCGGKKIHVVGSEEPVCPDCDF